MLTIAIALALLGAGFVGWQLAGWWRANPVLMTLPTGRTIDVRDGSEKERT